LSTPELSVQSQQFHELYDTFRTIFCFYKF